MLQSNQQPITTQQTSGASTRKGSGHNKIISPNNLAQSRNNRHATEKSTVEREMRTQSTGAVNDRIGQAK